MGIKVSTGGGGGQHFFKPDDGMFVLEFVSFEETTKKAFNSEEIVPAWRWNFKMYHFDTKLPVIDAETGEPAVYSDRVNRSLDTRSNAYSRFAALLAREIEAGEDSDDLFREAVGKRCGGNFMGGWLKTTMRMPAGMLV